ncbi:MAG: hypothetical protein QOJ29_1029 [Thermoleophilaceae bacterium]|nr:hypothetical protein [Thermoleophilaceae bacterium]
MPVTTKTTFPRLASSIRTARQRVRRELGPILDNRTEIAVLLASEAVTNAVEHSSADTIEVVLVISPDRVRIEVGTPGGAGWGQGPQLHPPAIDDVAGRGVFLIDELSDCWGTSARDATLWFEFELSGKRGGQRSAPALASRSRAGPPCQSKHNTVASSRSSPPHAATTARVRS